MKSIYSDYAYFTILFINFIANIPLYASTSSPRPKSPLRETRRPRSPLCESLIPMPLPSSLTNPQNNAPVSEPLLSITDDPVDNLSPTSLMAVTEKTNNQTLQLSKQIKQRYPNSQPSDVITKRLIINPMSNTQSTQNHTRRSKVVFKTIEYSALAATSIAFIMLMKNNNSSDQKGVFVPPTNIISAAWWVGSGLKSFASTGIGIGLVAYGFHKVKGWVGTIYLSETDRKIEQSEDRTNAQFDKFVQEEANPRFTTAAQSILQLCDIVEDLAQSQQAIAHHSAKMSAKLVQTNPTDPQLQEITHDAQNNSFSADEVLRAAHSALQEIGRNNENIIIHQISSPIRITKTDPCCSSCCF